MRKKLKILKICLTLGIIIALASCTEEKEYLENGKRDLKLSRKPFKELLSLKHFNSAYQKVKNEKQRSIALRSAIENEYNFTIVEGKDVKIVEVDNKTFYNILIQRDTASAVYFENLLLMVEKNNNIDDISAYIIKYEVPDTSILINPSSIDKEITTLFGRFLQTCYTACTPICITPWGDGTGGEGHVMVGDCTFHHLQCSEICVNDEIGNGGGGIDTGSGGGGSSGTTPSDPTPPTPSGAQGASPPPELLIDPVFEEVEEIQDKKPCDKLNAMVNTVIANVTPTKTAMTNFMDLKNNVTINRERLYVMSPKINSNGSFNHSLYNEYYAHSEPNQDNVSADFGNIKFDVMVHTHWDPSKHLSVFSLEDIYQIYLKIATGQINLENKDYFTAMLITAHGTQYAMKFYNIDNFVTWADNYFVGWNYPNQALRDRYQNNKETKFYNETNIIPGNTPEIKVANELALTNFLKTNNVGMDLYRVDDTFTQFTKLSTTLTGTLSEKPCNN